jgi:4-hydroxy-3-methylbut-2-enyl diphosphate reductase
MSDQQLTPTEKEIQNQEDVMPPREEPNKKEEDGVTPSEVVAPSAVEEAKESQVSSSETPESQEPLASSEKEPVRPSKGAQEGAKSEDELLFEAALASLENRENTTGEVRRIFSKGERVEATVIQVEKDRVFVDLGTKSEGVVPLGELTDQNLETAEGHVQVGDKIQVIVLKPEGAEGNAVVSKRRADFETAWEKIVQAYQEQQILVAPVIDRVKGGLVVDVGVRGFVPTSHVGNGKLRNIDKFIGESLPFKVLEIDKERKKVVLSNRNAEEETRNEAKERLFATLQIGDIVEGTIRRLTDYGAFVDLGGMDGLLHISEMSWTRIDHPKEVLKEGQEVKVMVLKLDPETSKISLGLRQVLPDPWNLIKENYRVGQKIDAKISRVVPTGAFIKLPEGAEAFLPIGEISFRRIKKVSDVLEEGQELMLTVIDLRPDERRMVLSLKDAGGIEAITGVQLEEKIPGKKKKVKRLTGEGELRERKKGTVAPAGASKVTRIPTGGATIGERLSGLKDFLSVAPEVEEEKMEEPATPKKALKKAQSKAEQVELESTQDAHAPVNEGSAALEEV